MKMAATFCKRRLLNFKNCLFQTQKRTGYVVLIPEAPEEVAECGVSTAEHLPDFQKLDKNTCQQLVSKYAQQYDVGAWKLDDHLKAEIQESNKVDVFKNVLEPLEVVSVPFFSAWNIAKTLYIANQKLMPAATFSPLNERAFQIRNEKFSIKSIYDICKKELEGNSDKLTDEQKRVLKKFVWEGFCNGFELEEKDRETLIQNYSAESVQCEQYKVKYHNATLLFQFVMEDPKFAEECPLDLLRNSALKADNPLNPPWIITLKDAVYYRYLQYCQSREARRHIWLTRNQMCSIRGDRRCSTLQEVDFIRQRRKETANLLGFPTYAHLAMKTKMAETVENVKDVLDKLLVYSKYGQEKELYELEKFAYNYEFRGSMEPWDIPYWKRMYQKYIMGLDEMSLNEYFPLSQVLLGLFALCEQLFGIIIKDQTPAEVWHPDVRYYSILDERTKSVIGGFYFDPYARQEKVLDENNEGWFIPMRPKSSVCSTLPLSSLIFSFTPPEEDKPSLLYFREVESLFSKFGLMLQHTMTNMNYSEVSGLVNIEWDAVGVSSEFLKFWLSEKGTLESISGHYETGEPLPSQMLDTLSTVNKHMAGTNLSLNIYRANLDLELHLTEDAPLSIAGRLWPQHLLFQHTDLDQHPYGFREIFGNSLGASYYSGIWSRMMAADVFSAFEEVGFNNHEEISVLGKRFRSTFLALGGGCDPKEVFRRFRGRDLVSDSLTKLLNLKKPVSINNNALESEPQLNLNIQK